MKFPIVTICGSMRYYKAMLVIARDETIRGSIVLMPFVTNYIGGKPPDDIKRMLDEMHRAKIDLSDSIIVVGSHIGESTQNEIEYAKSLSKGRIDYTTVDHLL